MKNQIIKVLVVSVIFSVIGLSWEISKILTLKRVGSAALDYLKVSKTESPGNFQNPYSFLLDDEKSKYIVELCEDFSVDPDLVVAILSKENPSLIVDAVSGPNLNGTADLGLFQLNDRYLFAKGGFLDLFWPKDFPEFEASNWKHNSYIAVKHIKDLSKKFGEFAYDNIAAAYNCGASRVFNGTIPDSTKYDYVPYVMAVLRNLKMQKEGQ